ncbi:ABC transporter substrate-binding protein [Pseudoalteromonas phenolica]|nr:ABC transporter substrate-binding protein [Pseudoalteromonas phenolica]
MKGYILTFLFALCFFSQLSWAEKYKFNIYHDSDYSTHFSSANAMKMGFLSALETERERLQNFDFEFMELDHRGNSNRSLLHMKKFLKDPNALFMLGGLHSPPYIKNRTYINKEGILLLVPWAAGGPITRYEHGTNWVFRLSIDDTKAGYRIIQFANDIMACSNPHLLLEDTPWGKSNERTMKDALGETIPEISWFSWNTRLKQAKLQIRGILEANADCVIFVGNSVEGKYFIQAMSEIDESLQKPIISHWGITGGDFYENARHFLNNISLHFIQSCFSFTHSSSSKVAKKAIKSANRLFKTEFNLATLQAPAGFIHGYDLGLLFAQAMTQIKMDREIKIVRSRLRDALENIELPIEGLIKVYSRPFKREGVDAHEALGLSDFCMATYKNNGAIEIILNEGV